MLLVIAQWHEGLKLLMAKLYIRFLMQSRRSNPCDLSLLLLRRVFSKLRVADMRLEHEFSS